MIPDVTCIATVSFFFWLQVTAFSHIPQGYLGVLGPGFSSMSPERASNMRNRYWFDAFTFFYLRCCTISLKFEKFTDFIACKLPMVFIGLVSWLFVCIG